MPFAVTYNGNGRDGGSPPVDPHGWYNQGETVPLQSPDSMTKTGPWFRHDGRGDGSFQWADSNGRQIGTGWNKQHVFFG